MIELHPEFLTKNGKKFAVLPYEEFLKIQELLEETQIIENSHIMSMKKQKFNSIKLRRSPIINLSPKIVTRRQHYPI
ncbi:type II toxin-antitoxin system Phd/YefM family antitoxin [Crocosphaera sp.]|uniref:type II toxin-antitoxin system Phd/YefM family antitoxin n=1 Tax=Crocosphaera sp. TaxID=2729996 RepID=UPI002603EF00|nr:type II toxin-antitoxin system Phd/YefM family antitoxin [Crocosphaera sp.]MDJ0580085.1 type II toxin-antitoxin system Phd/YefM family antitoxin [Crocosphaera sp.]